MCRTVCFLFIITLPLGLRAQVLPREGGKLNYRLIGFSFPPGKNVSNYIVEIAAGNFNNEDSFRKNVIITGSGKNNKIIVEVPAFGKQYTWDVVYQYDSSRNMPKGNINLTQGGLHHFQTMTGLVTDTGRVRLRITKKAAKYKDAYVFVDGNQALYDMQGNPVWFLPGAGRFDKQAVRQLPNGITMVTSDLVPLNDLKVTQQGTITFVYNNEQGYEVNYSGDILWKAPDDGKISGEATEYYHHDLTRLANGHYMIMGNENENVLWGWRRSLSGDSAIEIPVPGDIAQRKAMQKMEFGTLIEYDHSGNPVWSWKASSYFIGYDKYKNLYSCVTRNGPSERMVHENAFFFDEKDSIIYISFRNVSTIVRIKYPSGKILAAYGGYVPIGDGSSANTLFCYQHGCKRSREGYLYLFDNNMCDLGGHSKIEVIREPVSPNDKPKVIWEYTCADNSITMGKPIRIVNSGGNVIELPGQSYFVCMGRDYGTLFIVGHDKQLIWSAVTEMKDVFSDQWDIIHPFRASIITDRKILERLIWNTELQSVH